MNYLESEEVEVSLKFRKTHMETPVPESLS